MKDDMNITIFKTSLISMVIANLDGIEFESQAGSSVTTKEPYLSFSRFIVSISY